jgi:arylsulfatase A-like enzyme
MKPGIESMDKCPAHFTRLDASQTTLAEHLTARGYRTAGVTGNYARVCRQFGFQQGFGYYHDTPRLVLFVSKAAPAHKYGLDAVDRLLGCNGKLLQPFWDAESVTRMALDWVERNKDGPFFLFMNYMDPHYPYSAVRPYGGVNPDAAGYDVRLRQGAWQELITRYINTGRGVDDVLMSSAVRQYDGAIAYTDRWIGELADYLRREGLYDDTLVIVTSDHGEFFGEHGLLDHSLELYEQGVRVPIVVKYPKQAGAGARTARRVSTIDIFATVLETAGIELPDVQAQSLEHSSHEIMAENYESGLQGRRYGERLKRTLTVIYSGDLKYVSSTNGRNQLYDLANDPTEAHNLYGTDPAEAARLQGLISQWRARTPDFVPAVSAQQTEPQRPGRTVEPDFDP